VTDKASPKGWVVQVTTRSPAGSPSVYTYDAAISDAFDALEAVRKVSGVDSHATLEAVAELPAGTDLRPGEVLLR
jgi:hypothetical protein